MRGVVRQFRKLPKLSVEEKNVLSTQLKNLDVPIETKKIVVQRFRDRYYQIEDSLEDDFLLSLCGSFAFPPLLVFAIDSDLDHSNYMNARIFCDDELKKY